MTDPNPAGYLVAHALTRRYPGAPRNAVDAVGFALRKGEMLALLGPSGCGKTTLLRMIAGLAAPDAGTLTLDGRDLRDVALHQRRMGMVFQSYALFPHLSVARNIGFGLEVRGIARAERQRRVAEMIALTRLEGFEDRRIGALSGGQRQRVALARALAVRPDVLLLDEPLANLDVQLRAAMRAEIRALQTRLGVTAIFVTHDQDEALSMADRVAVMSQGRIRQIDTPAGIYERPADRFVASFVGRANFLDARYEDGAAVVDGVGRIALPDAAPWAGTRTLLLRPHLIRLGEPGQGHAAIVKNVDYTGEKATIGLSLGTHRISVEQPARSRDLPVPGQHVGLTWDPRDLGVLEDTA